MEGQPNYVIDNFPQFVRPQDPDKTEEDQTKMKIKVDKVIKSFHIDPGTVFSLTHMFNFYKGLMIFGCHTMVPHVF